MSSPERVIKICEVVDFNCKKRGHFDCVETVQDTCAVCLEKPLEKGREKSAGCLPVRRKLADGICVFRLSGFASLMSILT
jgi:hypothetical protein